MVLVKKGGDFVRYRDMRPWIHFGTFLLVSVLPCWIFRGMIANEYLISPLLFWLVVGPVIFSGAASLWLALSKTRTVLLDADNRVIVVSTGTSPFAKRVEWPFDQISLVLTETIQTDRAARFRYRLLLRLARETDDSPNGAEVLTIRLSPERDQFVSLREFARHREVKDESIAIGELLHKPMREIDALPVEAHFV